MLKELILRYSSRRASFKLAGALAGVAILLVGTIEKVGVGKGYLWMAAPLLLLGFAEAGYAGEQRRCIDLLKKGNGADDLSALVPESAGASVVRFGFAVLSPSIWPFYLVLFGLVAFGGEEIARANREVASQAIHALNANVAAPGYIQTSNGPVILPSIPQRPGNGAFPANRPPLNPALQRVTPPVFATPPHMNIPVRSSTPPHAAPVTPPPVSSQSVNPAPASPVPGAKNP
jgi:hypothetical protein